MFNFLRSIGHKIAGGVHNMSNLGKKVLHKAAGIAGKYVEPISDYVAKGAMVLGAGLAATGVGAPIAAGVEGFAGLAEGISAGAGLISRFK